MSEEDRQIVRGVYDTMRRGVPRQPQPKRRRARRKSREQRRREYYERISGELTYRDGQPVLVYGDGTTVAL